MKSLSHARLFVTPWTVACTKLLHPWDFPGKSTGVGCHFLLQGIFLTQGTQVSRIIDRCFTVWATREVLNGFVSEWILNFCCWGTWWKILYSAPLLTSPAMGSGNGNPLFREWKWQLTPVFLPGESHGQSLVGYSPWGRKELHMTEQLKKME